MKMQCIRLLAIIYLLLLCHNSYSQQYFVKTYTIENGLATRVVNDACQDSTGVMWFATNSGISRYDGLTFRNYDVADGIPFQVYKRILIDRKGILWGMPDMKSDSVVYLEGGIWHKIKPIGAEPSKLNSFAVEYIQGKPTICIGSNEGYYIYSNGLWKKYTIHTDRKKNIVSTVRAQNQRFYLATHCGLFVVTENTTDTSYNQLLKPNGIEIIAINFDKTAEDADKLWVLNEKWVGFIKNNKLTVVSDQFQLPPSTNLYFSFIQNDSKGNIYFGNIWAKYFLSGSSKVPHPLMIGNGFSSEGATSVFIDREQNIWFTDTRGISKFNNTYLLNYYQKDGMRENEVSAIVETNDGRLILGHNKGLSIFNNRTFKRIDFPVKSLHTKRVLDIMKDRDGNIWFISIELGLGKLLPDDRIKWYTPNENTNYSSVHQDKTGRIWIGAGKGLAYLSGETIVPVSYFNESAGAIRKIFSAKQGGIYIASMKGLWHINNSTAKLIPAPDDKKADNIFAYYCDSKGNEFVGSSHGLYSIENGRIVKYAKNGIDINNPVYFIFQDNDGQYWIGSNNGLYRWDGKNSPVIYNTNNGLAGWETNRSAGYIDSKGRMWIGTDRGLSCFEPGFNKDVIPVPKVVLLDAEDSKGNKYSLNTKNTIIYTNNTLNFNFRGISFYNEDLLEYTYKLEGFDQKWQVIDQSMLDKVRYIGLRPGKYTLHVKARNFSGQWSEVISSQTILITPPYYFTWWFILLLGILVTGIITGIIRIRVQKVNNSLLQKEIDERKRIEEALIESKQKYKDLVELLPETIFEADSRGNLLYMNDTGFRLFGEALPKQNKPIQFYTFVDSVSRDEFNKQCALVQINKQSAKVEITALMKNGTPFPASVHMVPILQNQRCIGIRGIIIDLTEQKHFEEQLQKNAADLSALNTSKDKFFSIIAHDLRSPFTTFLGFTEMLDEEFDTLPQEEMQTIVSFMRKSASNLYQLLENLLEWSLLHRDITPFAPIQTKLIPHVNSCIEIMHDSAAKKDIIITSSIPEEISVTADIHMLQTVIRNLISNAIKFTHRGGTVHISAETKSEQIVVISVKDTGIGIEANVIPTLFLIDTNSKTKGTDGEVSTGLGLILCKEFVEKHNGKIWVESEAGKGSTFYFSLRSI